MDRNIRPLSEEMVENVAPFPGAWIETSKVKVGRAQRRVAPFPGAWIETDGADDDRRRDAVAPFPGAWIETIT